jgi:hypothetical protein
MTVTASSFDQLPFHKYHVLASIDTAVTYTAGVEIPNGFADVELYLGAQVDIDTSNISIETSFDGGTTYVVADTSLQGNVVAHNAATFVTLYRVQTWRNIRGTHVRVNLSAASGVHLDAELVLYPLSGKDIREKVRSMSVTSGITTFASSQNGTAFTLPSATEGDMVAFCAKAGTWNAAEVHLQVSVDEGTTWRTYSATKTANATKLLALPRGLAARSLWRFRLADTNADGVAVDAWVV